MPTKATSPRPRRTATLVAGSTSTLNGDGSEDITSIAAAPAVPPPPIAVPTSPVAAVPPPFVPQSTRPSRARLILAVGLLSALLGFAGGIAGSALHRGPAGTTGSAGQTGAKGDTGLTGSTGPAGSAAQVSELGVCYDTSSSSGGGSYWLTSMYLTSPSKHPDGTTYCPSGSYVPVAPQSDHGGGG
jgi:hypothetical protein